MIRGLGVGGERRKNELRLVNRGIFLEAFSRSVLLGGGVRGHRHHRRGIDIIVLRTYVCGQDVYFARSLSPR